MRRIIFSALLLTSVTAIGCQADRASVAPDSDFAHRGVSVTGMGEASGAPDLARVEMGVQARAATAGEATDQVSRQMQAVVEALAQQGIEAKDLQTQNVSVHEERSWQPPPPPRPGAPDQAQPSEEKLEFVASNMLTVTVRDLAKLSNVLTAATGAGVNQMYGIRFELEESGALEQQALDEAFAEAKAKAEHLAQVSGVRLGRILSIQVGDTNRVGPPMPMMDARMAKAESSAQVPVERGEMTVHQQVHVQYAIER